MHSIFFHTGSHHVLQLTMLNQTITWVFGILWYWLEKNADKKNNNKKEIIILYGMNTQTHKHTHILRVSKPFFVESAATCLHIHTTSLCNFQLQFWSLSISLSLFYFVLFFHLPSISYTLNRNFILSSGDWPANWCIASMNSCSDIDPELSLSKIWNTRFVKNGCYERAKWMNKAKLY